MLEALSGSDITAPDPLAERITSQQPGPRFEAYCSTLLAEMEAGLEA